MIPEAARRPPSDPKKMFDVPNLISEEEWLRKEEEREAAAPKRPMGMPGMPMPGMGVPMPGSLWLLCCHW
jgi:hypothetical protein